MKLNKRYITLALSALMLLPAAAQQKSPNVLDLKYSIQDSNILYPESYETDIRKLQERWYLKNYTSADLNSTLGRNDPGATDEEIKQRLQALPTVIEMPFNSIVKSYIERYTKKGRQQVTALLGLASYYMPIFERALEEEGLPMELKYLPVIESGLDPNATSKHGAAGLWQFMLIAAKGYDMEVNSLVDERRDPYISSRKACRLLKDLHESFGDWSLAIAAYNCGPGTVNKALARAGGNPDTHDFWSIYFYLPEETRGYFPMFIAANYVMNYYPEHNILPVLATKPLITDTVQVRERIHFNQISGVLDIPVEELRVLNPQYRADIIPASEAKPCSLTLPSQQIHAYIVSEDQILAFDRDKYAFRAEVEPGSDPGVMAEEIVTVKAPENPEDLVAVEQVAADLTYNQLHPEAQAQAEAPRRRRGQTETAAAPEAVAETPAPAATPAPAKPAKNTTTTKKENNSNKNNNSKNNNTKATPKTHTVVSGETLSSIAKKNGVTVEQLRKANPKLKGDIIRPGDKLSLPAKKKKK